MARTLTAPSRLYAPGAYGPFAVDQLAKGDTSALEWVATIEGWPTDPALKLFRVEVRWSTGAFAAWTVYGGRRNRDGTPATEVRERLFVPTVIDPATDEITKDAVASGTMSVQVFEAVRSTLTIGAVA